MSLTIRLRIIATACITVAALSTGNTGLAAMGRNGGGKPGGNDDPSSPAPPVTYGVTVASIPGTNVAVYGHNEAAAMVGSLYDAPVGARRALVYLPEVSTNTFVLDELPGLQGKLGWHTRSAADINNNGTIVGNLEPDGMPDTEMRSYLVTGATTGSPALHELPLVDPTAQREIAAAINDSGDVIVSSERTLPDGSIVDRMYVGNPGLDGEPAQPFIEIDFASHGFPNPNFFARNFSITNRSSNGNAVAVGEFSHGGQEFTFRVNSDGTGLEFAPDYIADDGSHIYWDYNGFWLDINAAGDVTGGAYAEPAKKGKTKPNDFAALWKNGSDEILPVGDFSPFESDWNQAALNDNGDFLLHGYFSARESALWHGDWSPANGELDIANLIDPSDPNGYLYTNTFDLLNRNANGWPTILAHGAETLADGTNQPYWLILTPQPTSTALASTAIPEPVGVVLGLLAVSSIAVVRRVSSCYSAKSRMDSPRSNTDGHSFSR